MILPKLETDYNYWTFLLVISFDSKLKQYAEKILDVLLTNSGYIQTFEREFGFNKGKVNFFDPDFNGLIF